MGRDPKLKPSDDSMRRLRAWAATASEDEVDEALSASVCRVRSRDAMEQDRRDMQGGTHDG